MSAADTGDAPDGERLAAAVRALGVDADVEARGRLAVLRHDGDPALLADAPLRRRLTAAALEHGFTHLALELSAPASITSQAGVPGDPRAGIRRPQP